MASQPGKQIVAIHILLNISRIKDNQTMKFGKLIESGMITTFLEKPYTKCDAETIPRHFCKFIKIEHTSGSIFQSFIKFAFVLCQVEGYPNIMKLICRLLDFTWYKAFFKNQKVVWNFASLSHVLHNLWRKIFILLYFINCSNFTVWLPLLCEIFGNMCLLIVY